MGDPIAERLRDVLAKVAAIAPERASESEEPRRRLEALPDTELERLARDRSESEGMRKGALGVFVERNRTEKAAADLLLELLDDPVEGIALEVIRRALPFDTRMIERLRALMEDPREAFWKEASLALARRKDRAILPTLTAWFREGGASHRRLAIEALDWILHPPEKPAVFAAAWESGRGDAEERLGLAERLLALGDERGVMFLDELAEHGPEPLAGRAKAALRDWAWRDGEG